LRVWSGKGDSNPRPSAWEAVKALVRPRPVVSARAYLVGSGGDSVVPPTSSTVPIHPSAWLQFGYSARRLFCSPVRSASSLDAASRPIPGRHGCRYPGLARPANARALLGDFGMDALGHWQSG